MIAFTREEIENEMRPLVTGWLGKISESIHAKKGFSRIADQCMAFFSAETGFMWDEKFQSTFTGGKSLNPRFRFTMAKAFEYVSLYLPSLYWDNPQRIVRPIEYPNLPPDALFQSGDPMAQFMYQQVQQQQQSHATGNAALATILQAYLNFTPAEMPGGGLDYHAKMAIIEALVKGRGVLWPAPYKRPASDMYLTGCFYDSVDNLFIDPDAESLDDATWIAQKCCHHTWQVEDEYRLKKGSLKGKGSDSSLNAMGESEGDKLKNLHRKSGKTSDLITYYKVWSKCGVGGRLSGVNAELVDGLERVLGDYCYIVVANGVPYPLNAPSEEFKTALNDDVFQMFQWPVPYWKDGRWPCAVLDFYPKPRDPWPIAPLAPGLGELMFLNVMMSHLANRIHTSSRDFIAISKNAGKAVKAALQSGDDLTIIELDDINKNIDELVKFVQQPQTNFDVWKIIEAVMQQFVDRVGLAPLMYGQQSGPADRSAAASQVKKTQIGVRPEFMGKMVAKWQRDAAAMEMMCAVGTVQPQDVAPRLGPAGAHLWQQLITGANKDVVIRAMNIQIEAGSMRRPDKDRDQQNAQTLLQNIMPVLQAYSHDTGDTNPLNGMFKEVNEAFDGLNVPQLGPWHPMPPPPDPAAQQQQQMQAQLQDQKVAAQTHLMEAKAQHQQTQAMLDQQVRAGELSHQQQSQQQELQQAALSHAQEMAQAHAQAQQEIQHNAQRHAVEQMLLARKPQPKSAA